MSHQRKHPKQIGVNIELAKKERDRKTLKIGKERRANTIQLHRKVMEEAFAEEGEDVDMSAPSSANTHADRRMPRMLEMAGCLSHADPSVHLPACVFFRKILAIEKHPPLQLVLASGAVSLLIEILSHGGESAQYECAWCLTNLACGDKNLLESLLESNIVPTALTLIVSSANDDVREQCLWLLCNLASSAEITRGALLHHGVMAHLLSFMRIPPHTGPSSDLLQPVHLLEQVLRQKLQKESRTLVLRTPSLLAMTHVANIISYMVRSDLPLPNDRYTLLSIVHLAPTLLQSPDENVVNSTCSALVNILSFPGRAGVVDAAADVTVTSPNVALQVAMEKGIMRRMKHLHASTSSENTRQAVLSVLCAALKAENPLHRLTVLQRGPPFFELLEWVLQQLRAMERKEAEGGDISNLNEFHLHIFNCLSVMLLESSESKYADQLIKGDIHLLLVAIIERNNHFEVSSQAGRCLCSLLLRGSHEAVCYVGPTLFPNVMARMIASPDMHLVLLSLSSVAHLTHQQHVSSSSTALSFSFLTHALLQDIFYDTLESLVAHSQDEQIRERAVYLVEYADEVRQQE